MKSALPVLCVFLTASCRVGPDSILDSGTVGNTCTWYVDSDGDGFGSPDAAVQMDCEYQGSEYSQDGTDCDDATPSVNPGASEICDGLDQDCDGEIDEDPVDGGTWYPDLDEDGFGDPESAISACEEPSGVVSDGTDCDDQNNTVNPGGIEICNGLDDDCDGEIDEGRLLEWFLDKDGDGWGVEEYSILSCDAPEGYVLYAGDCDDSDPAYHPSAEESDCSDPNDYNCDGSTGYADLDEDGFAACEECEDMDASIFPGADEYCDLEDNDCDGEVDEDDALDASTWYLDEDLDGFGQAEVSLVACYVPDGYVGDATDCDDSDSFVNPSSFEICNDVDDDCDGQIDEEALDASWWYRDLDSDGYGDAAEALESCQQPTGYVVDYSDCDDTDSAVNTAATEYCDGIDNDCDGEVDEDDAADAAMWYQDGDGDGFGNPASFAVACVAAEDYVADSSDCDDSNASVHPGADEYCNDVDDDCDGEVDEDDALDASTWYLDYDEDGFGDAVRYKVSCEAPDWYVADSTDCDDVDGSIHPGASEICDGLDDDCDGEVDEGAVDPATWYADLDGDGYGDPGSSAEACQAPEGYVADSTDCDDGEASVHPGADEYCNETDDDCDGEVDEGAAVDAPEWYVDADEDGYGDETESLVACEAPSGYSASPDDCDDSDPQVHPEANDACDGVDQDCDGQVDENSTDGQHMITADTTGGFIYRVDPDGTTTVISELDPGYSINTVAVDDAGRALGYDVNSGKLVEIDVCSGTIIELGATGTELICGLSFADDGRLYAIDQTSNQTFEVDTETGLATYIGDLGFDLGPCGMAHDCSTDELIGADRYSGNIFRIDASTGEAYGFVETSVVFGAVGLEYDPPTGFAYAATGTKLYQVDIETGATTSISSLDVDSVDDLVYYPECP